MVREKYIYINNTYIHFKLLIQQQHPTLKVYGLNPAYTLLIFLEKAEVKGLWFLPYFSC